jgi:hypothetical protein
MEAAGGEEEIRFRHQLLQEYFTAQTAGADGEMTAAELRQTAGGNVVDGKRRRFCWPGSIPMML